MNTTIQTEVPPSLLRQAQDLVDRGWASNVQDLMAESLRRYLESHQESLLEQHVQADVAWGLHGDD
jgi:Arc/MetJ-type ribon-helix-helix transcriptional regulator